MVSVDKLETMLDFNQTVVSEDALYISPVIGDCWRILYILNSLKCLSVCLSAYLISRADNVGLFPPAQINIFYNGGVEQ